MQRNDRQKNRKSLDSAEWSRDRANNTLESSDKHFLHVHILNKHVPFLLAIIIFAFVISIAIGVPIYLTQTNNNSGFSIPGANIGGADFVYGSWPALENADFFNTVKAELISNEEDFIESDLSNMVIRVYKNGQVESEVPIISKGREGSWWETPAGIYSVQGKEENHFSSFGQVNMPWSIPFQGNFFIHGWPTYPNGSPVAQGYSGGCIRLSTEDAEEVFHLASNGMPVLVFEDAFSGNIEGESFEYAIKTPNVNAKSYLAADLENNFVFSQSSLKEERSIASLTKLMTALIAVEYINVEREVAITPSMIIETSIPRLNSGDSFSVLDLLSVLLMESSNEAARAISIPLGESRFMSLMNIKAGAIGMNSTNFVDTSGVHSGNVSTAQDLFMLAKYLYYNRSFVLHMSIGNEKRAVYGPSAFYGVQNLNQIPGTEGMVGGKTGLSTAAGDSMLSVFEVEIEGEKRPIAIIVLGSDDGKRDTASILQHIKSNYGKKTDDAPTEIEISEATELIQ